MYIILCFLGGLQILCNVVFSMSKTVHAAVLAGHS